MLTGSSSSSNSSRVESSRVDNVYCQKSRINEDFNMDDDMCGKPELVKTGGCACASTLGSVNLYSVLPRVHPGR